MTSGGAAGSASRALAAITVVLAGVALTAITPAYGDECGTYDGRGCAPATRRVDLATPQFSHPTTVTNPLFPISDLHSALLLGHVDSRRFRTETTLLPGTTTIRWGGRDVEVLVSQYVAYSGRRITEVALDHYAQADDGSVWYLGEDVFDYRHGAVSATEGTWRAGRDGPAAMIMPGTPHVGDVYRTENIPGVVFEEVTVTAVGRVVRGPTGPVPGGLLVDELHSDRTHEAKLFAPGYGEFRTSGGGDLEALAMAVPTDARSGPEPAALAAMATSAEATLESARLRDWPAAVSTVRRLRTAWRSVAADTPPWRVAARTELDLGRLRTALRKHQPARLGQRAVDVWQSVLDLQLRYRPTTEVDLARMHLWTQQLRVFASRRSPGGVAGATATLEWMRDRVSAAVSPSALADIDARLGDVRAAADTGNLRAAADRAARLGLLLRS